MAAEHAAWSTRAGARAARGRGSRRPVGRRRLFPAGYTGDVRAALDGDDAQPADTAAPRARPASASARRRSISSRGRRAGTRRGQRYFDGEVEPCINGRTVETGAYFGVDMTPLVDRLLAEWLEDGGWNCEAESAAGAVVVRDDDQRLEGLLEYERAAVRGSAGVQARLRRRGVHARALPVPPQVHRRGDHPSTSSTFPYSGTYDVLRGLDYFRQSALVRIHGWRRRWRWCG